MIIQQHACQTTLNLQQIEFNGDLRTNLYMQYFS